MSEVLWQGEHVQASVDSVFPAGAQFMVWDWGARWVEYYVGYRHPRRTWYAPWRRQLSIHEAAARAVQIAMRRDREQQEVERQVSETREEVEAIAEVQRIAASL